ncbi:MAG TPA: hypothetical protein VKE22_21375 [Haliangiales bacterium]|nr:hypothetical protein [Haliangiales bacterium]
MAVDPGALVLDPGATARVAAPPDARVIASLGQVRDGAYDPGGRRAPGYAVVIAALGDERAAAVVTLVGVGALPTQTVPGASVVVRVGERRFGPVVADAAGRADVPVEVPPGEAFAVVEAAQPGGLRTTAGVPLPATAFPPGAAIGPEDLEVGRRGTVSIFAITGAGAWRPVVADPPVVTAPPPFRLVGVPHAVAPGRWDIDVEADAAGEVDLAVEIDGTPLAPVRLRAHAPPPPVPPPDVTTYVGVRAGGGTAFGSAWAMGAGAEVCFLERRGAGLALELAAWRTTATTFYGQARDTDLFYASAAAALRLRVPLGGGWAAWLGAGAGVARASASGSAEFAPMLEAGGSLAVAVGPGELALDLRWVDARFDDFALGLEGNPLGALVTLGYLFRP